MCNPRNSESWHTDSYVILRNLTYLKPNTYLEPSKRFKIKVAIIFTKPSILDLWQGSEYAHLSISSLTFRVALRYASNETYPEPSLLS